MLLNLYPCRQVGLFKGRAVIEELQFASRLAARDRTNLQAFARWIGSNRFAQAPLHWARPFGIVLCTGNLFMRMHKRGEPARVAGICLVLVEYQLIYVPAIGHNLRTSACDSEPVTFGVRKRIRF